MTGKRIPKQGEVWTIGGETRTVWCVSDDHVAVGFPDGSREVVTLDYFTASYTPPEPTVADSLHVGSNRHHQIVYGGVGNPTHRLDLMSDGEFRVVKL